MIITSTLKVEEFYSNMQESDGEQAKQLKRRFTEVVCVTKDTITTYAWNEKKNSHQFACSVPNDLIERFQKSEEETIKKSIEKMKMLGFKISKDALEDTVKVIEQLGFTQIDMPDDDLPF